MAAQRPVVLVFQEFATLSSSPAVPELECLITGPAYWIQDFPDDRANIQLTPGYGLASGAAATGAPVVTSALTVTDAPNNVVGAVLDSSSVRIFLGNAQVELAHGLDMTATVRSPVVGSIATNFVTAGVAALDTLVMTSGATTLTRTIVSFDANTLTLNNETPMGFGLTAIKFRVQRSLPETELDKSFISGIAATNTITVAALATMGVSGAQKSVVSADVYVGYRSLRLDLQDVTTIGDTTKLVAALGRIDSRNPLAVGVSTALANTNTTIQYYGVNADTLTGYTEMKDAIGGRKDIYAVVPLNSDISVLAMLKTEFEALADPDLALLNGVPQKFRVAIGSAAVLPTTKTVVDVVATGATQANAAATAPTTHHTLNLTGLDLVAANVQPGDTLTISADVASSTRNGTYVVAQVVDIDTLELDTEPPGGAESANATVVIHVGATNTIRLASSPVTGLATVADAQPVIDLYDPAGTFVDDSVHPGDLLELPTNPTQSSFASKDTFVVAFVVSNQRVRIVSTNGRNTSLLATELPHGVSRSSPATLIPTTNTLHYRVTRSLDKAGQVLQLISVSQSLKHRRVVNVWPDLCDVDGLVDGSLPRDPLAPTVAQPAATQPGFYLACAVGGMTAGLPSHQGFTNLGIAGIKKIYHANTYFSDKNITDLSNGGWFVLQQDNPQSLPYVVHQLTTDVTSLQTGEFSMVKNFDFVSLFLSDILDDYLGSWNINPETMGFISQGVVGGIDNLKLRRKPRIGAPIIDGKLVSLSVSPSSADRLEMYVECKFPAPLNIVALHLVSA